ncbi:MAG: DMT family transporter [Candidatus Bipolaricaulota bacterium]|nr:MAG: DMT family transporter [Candidatus Bipolaricaulota bacterium]
MSATMGQAAALLTTVLWSFTYVFFTIAVRRIGASALNRLRLAAALGLLLLAHLVVFGTPVPFGAEASRWLWLGLSGVIGFAVAEALLFRSLYHLGAHRTSLLMTSAPVFSALLAWGVLGERLSPGQIAAVAVTLLGIVVVLWRRGNGDDGRGAAWWLGILFAVGAAAAQATRYILSKRGMDGGFPVLSTNVLQILCATVTIWLWTAVRGRLRATRDALRTPGAMLPMLAGATLGPFLGVTLSLVALRAAPVGIASTLLALPPVLLLFLERVLFRVPIRPQALIGTAIAVGGVAMLFML